MSVIDDDLIVVGQFSSAGGNTASNVARWDGSTWAAIGGGLPSRGRAVAEFQGEVYAGGLFGIRKFDAGLNGWTDVGGGLGSNARVNALIVNPDDALVVGGDFTGNIARWNGTQWNAFPPLHGLDVSSLGIFEGDLHAGGHIIGYQGEGGFISPANDVVRWDGLEWRPLGHELNGLVYDFVHFEDDLIAAGAFTNIDGIEVNGAARWDGSAWSAIGSGPEAYIVDIEIFGGQLVAAASTRVLRFTGADWEQMGESMNGYLACVGVCDGQLVVGGGFTHVGSTPVNRVAQWDGVAWQPMGSGLNDEPKALTEYQGDLIAAGRFTTAGGISARRIARWDGSAWHPLGTGLGDDAFALTEYDGDLVVGGWFSSAAGVNSQGIAAWNGSSWVGLGGGVSGIFQKVSSLGVFEGTLIAGGVFSHAGGVASRNVAQWDGAQWHALGDGIGISESEGSEVFALIEYGDELFAGGTFIRADDHISPYLARWGSPCEGTPATLTDFTIAFGTYLSGTLADLVASDNARVRVRSHFGFAASEANVLDLRIGAVTSVQNPAALDILVEGRLNQTGGTSKLRLRNWSTNAFQQVHQYPIGTPEIVETIEGVPAENRVRASDGRIELSIRQSALVTFSVSGFISSTDQVVIAVR